MAISGKRAFARLVGIAAAGCVIAGTSGAQTVDWQWSQTFSYLRGPATSSNGIIDQAELEWTPVSITEVEGVIDLNNGGRLTFGGDFTGVLHPFSSTRTEHITGVNASYRQNFGQNDRWRITLSGEADWAGNIRRWGFERQRVGGKLQFRYNPEHTIVGGLRVGYRNQNDAETFPGYDQEEYLAELTHAWRPYRDRRSLRSTLYSEARRAEFDQYSYDEIGLRFAGRYPISEDTEVTGRLGVYQREFFDAFGNGFDEIREDVRFRTVVEIDHAFSADVNSTFFVGYDSNQSNISVRAHSGIVLGASVTFTTD